MVPPPAAEAALMARLMAGESRVTPSAFAPKWRTLKEAAGWAPGFWALAGRGETEAANPVARVGAAIFNKLLRSMVCS